MGRDFPRGVLEAIEVFIMRKQVFRPDGSIREEDYLAGNHRCRLVKGDLKAIYRGRTASLLIPVNDAGLAGDKVRP